MNDRERRADYPEPKRGGPDRLLMGLFLGFIFLLLLRAFWLFH
jgi:hypothetical protein